jgi:phosphatidylserine/phosphatidylglycerophosphate/cardiolipin synthase-like enzyme
MFYNGAVCDIYIGKGAGKKLLFDIQNAQKSVRIVSPYLSPGFIAELIKTRQRNLEVELITTDDIEDYYGNYQKNIYKLIVQNRETDQAAVKQREKWKTITKNLIVVAFGLLLFLSGTVFYLRDLKVAFGLIPVAILVLLIKLYRDKIKNKRIYSYRYSKLFPFKVYMSPDKSARGGTFIHSKIYLIDDKVAYLGSLNFTSSGIKHNYETQIRTEDPNAIAEISVEINRLLTNSHLPERDIQYWGKQLYTEPIN